MVLIAFVKKPPLNAHVDISSGARSLSRHLDPFSLHCSLMWTCLIIRYANIYGLWVGIWMFDFILYSSTIFQLCRADFLGWTSTKLGQMCLAQGLHGSDACEARTRGPSVSSQALYHWATVLPFYEVNRVGHAGAHQWGFHTQCCWMCCWIRSMNIYGIGVGIWMVSEIFRTWRIGWPWACLSLGFQISNFLAKLYINTYHIKKFQNNPFRG